MHRGSYGLPVKMCTEKTVDPRRQWADMYKAIPYACRWRYPCPTFRMRLVPFTANARCQSKIPIPRGMFVAFKLWHETARGTIFGSYWTTARSCQRSDEVAGKPIIFWDITLECKGRFRTTGLFSCILILFADTAIRNEKMSSLLQICS